MSVEVIINIIRYEDGEMNQEEVVAFFQELIDTSLVWELQGHYDRMAVWLINQGLCHLKK